MNGLISDGEQTSLIPKELIKVPFLNQIFGGSSSFRTRELVRKGASSDQAQLKAVLKELENNDKVSKRYISIGIALLITHFAYGVLAMMLLEDWSVFDSIYFVIVTFTTVGYGDLSPKTKYSKIFVILYALVSICIASSYLAYFVGLFIDEQEEVLVSAILTGKNEDEESNRPKDPEEQIKIATEGIGESELQSMTLSILLLIVVFVSGVFIFVHIENLSFLDAIYTTIISSTTVGYGDFSPSTRKGRILASIWITFSTISLARVISNFTEIRMSAKERALARRVLTASMDTKSFQHLDRNEDGSVAWGEYLSGLLVSLGKVTQEEIDVFKTRFNDLDNNGDGKIRVSELRNN